MTNSVPTHGVPDPVEFQRNEGVGGVRVYECQECGESLRSTKAARDHTSCHPVPECPVCGSTDGRVDLGTDRGRVDVCARCGTTNQGVDA